MAVSVFALSVSTGSVEELLPALPVIAVAFGLLWFCGLRPWVRIKGDC